MKPTSGSSITSTLHRPDVSFIISKKKLNYYEKFPLGISLLRYYNFSVL